MATLDDYDRRRLKTFLKAIFGGKVDGWNMTPGMLALTIKMLHATRKCSRAIRACAYDDITRQYPTESSHATS